MAKSKETWNKKETEKKKEKKRQEKEQKKEERRSHGKEGKSFEDMLAYIDEDGNITSTPPDPMKKKKEIRAEDIEVNVPRQSNVRQTDVVRKGTVTFFNDSKGYGFIKDLETQDSVFVHVNNLVEPIREGNRVSFEVEMGQKGPIAVNVKTIG